MKLFHQAGHPLAGGRAGHLVHAVQQHGALARFQARWKKVGRQRQLLVLEVEPQVVQEQFRPVGAHVGVLLFQVAGQVAQRQEHRQAALVQSQPFLHQAGLLTPIAGEGQGQVPQQRGLAAAGVAQHYQARRRGQRRLHCHLDLLHALTGAVQTRPFGFAESHRKGSGTPQVGHLLDPGFLITHGAAHGGGQGDVNLFQGDAHQAGGGADALELQAAVGLDDVGQVAGHGVGGIAGDRLPIEPLYESGHGLGPPEAVVQHQVDLGVAAHPFTELGFDLGKAVDGQGFDLGIVEVVQPFAEGSQVGRSWWRGQENSVGIHAEVLKFCAIGFFVQSALFVLTPQERQLTLENFVIFSH